MHSAGLHRISRKSSGLSKVSSSTPPSSAASQQRPQVPFTCHSIDELLAANVGELHPKIRPWTTIAEGRPPRHSRGVAPPPPPPELSQSSGAAGAAEQPAVDPVPQPVGSPTRPSTVSEVTRMRQLLRDVIGPEEVPAEAERAFIDDDYDTFVSTHRSVLPESLSMQLLLAQQMAREASRKGSAPDGGFRVVQPPSAPAPSSARDTPSAPAGGRSARSSRIGTARGAWTPGETISKRLYGGGGGGGGSSPGRKEVIGTDADLETLRTASQESLTRLLLLVLRALLEPRRAVTGVLTPRETCTPSVMFDLLSRTFQSATAPHQHQQHQQSPTAPPVHSGLTKPSSAGFESAVHRSPRLAVHPRDDPQPTFGLPKLSSTGHRRGTGDADPSFPPPQREENESGVAGLGEPAYCRALLKRIESLQQDKSFLKEEVEMLQKELAETRNDMARISERYFLAVGAR